MAKRFRMRGDKLGVSPYVKPPEDKGEFVN